MQYVTPGSNLPQLMRVTARANGSPITAGTVSLGIVALNGANAGKWWDDENQDWAAEETLTAMTHVADGCWSVTLAASPFEAGTSYLRYAKESGNLHAPNGEELAATLMADVVAAIKAATYDGVTFEQWITRGLGAVINKATRDGATIHIKDRAGTTTILTLTYGTVAGERTGSEIA